MIFFASKRNGKLQFEAPKRLDEFITALPDCRISVEMKRWRKPRSLDQNNLFHGLCNVIAESVGSTLEEVKGGIKIEANLYRPKTKERPILLVSSADLNTEEMVILIDTTYRVAAEIGIVLPTPEEWKAMK